MFYSQVILAKKGPLAKVWLAAHWGDKKLARPQIFATDISQSCVDIMNPSVPLALRLSGHLLLGVVRIYSRKVKYVLNDCTEAMLKLQMAFSSSNNQKEGEGHLLDSSGAPTHQLVTNFGEFDKVHVVEGFCLPLPEDNEWILADENQNLTQNDQDLLLKQLPTRPSESQQHSSNSPGGQGNDDDEEEEQWAPFDPDNEDEDDPNMEGLPNNSRVSEIEVVRAANDSLLSEDQTVRESTSILNKSGLTDDGAFGPTTPSKNMEDGMDFAGVPFGEDDSEDEAPRDFTNNGLEDSALNLSRDGDAPLNASGLALDDSPNKNSTVDQQPKTKPRKRRRKRRKIVIDNHDTELSNEHIRHMLQTTDDIVRPMIHPGSIWDDSNQNDSANIKDYRTLVLEERARQDAQDGKPQRKTKGSLPIPSLTQPFLVDSGPLHPKLQQLWQDNYWKAKGEPCPYKRLEPIDDVENVRRDAKADDDDTSTLASDLNVAVDKDDAEKQQQAPLEEDEMEFPAVQDDEEEEPDVPVPDFGDSEDEKTSPKRKRSGEDEDVLELGMVNDMVLDSEEDDDDDEGRQALGDVASSATKWHKHTVRVFSHLKKSIRDPTKKDNETDDNEEELPQAVDFHDLTKHVVSRRNASSIFFELLQLKTWDFLELQQDDAYGKIAISAGVRFGEDAPNN